MIGRRSRRIRLARSLLGLLTVLAPAAAHPAAIATDPPGTFPLTCGELDHPSLTLPVAAPRLEIGGAALAGPERWTESVLGPDATRWSGLVAGGAGTPDLTLTRAISLSDQPDGALVIDETIGILPGAPIRSRVLVTVPLLRLPLAEVAQVIHPRRDGRALALEASLAHSAAFVLATDPVASGCVPLALPLLDIVRIDGRRLALMADPWWGTTFDLAVADGELRLAASWSAPGATVPWVGQQRTFRMVSHERGFAGSVDAFFAAHSPARGPQWTRDIGLVYFDYLADGGRGWKRDLDALAQRIAPADRRRVAVALHGWYDRIGSYAYDAPADRFLDSWTAQRKRDGGVSMSVAEVRRRLDEARALGFRTLLYFADGIIADRTTAMGARASTELGRSTWNGPEVEGELLLQNPADPEVRRWFLAYTRALLRTFGDRIDGLVWDETFWIRPRAVVTQPEPAHADVAMLSLVRLVADRVHRFNPELALLASDTIGHEGIDAPPYAIMAHGTFQDAESNPWAWGPGLFPAWEAPLWSVNWGARIRFDDTRTGVLRFAAPVSLSNGWADDLGPAEMDAELLDRAIALFAWQRAHRALRPRWLEVDPAVFLGAPLPAELPLGSFRIAPALGDQPPAPDHPSWRPAAADALRYLDAQAALGAEVDAAWVEAILPCQKREQAVLNAGSHGPLRIWLDGRERLHVRGERRHSAGADRVTGLELGAGDHHLLVRFERRPSGFGFSLRIDGDAR